MVYHLMSMIPFGEVVRYQHCAPYRDLDAALRVADSWNRTPGYKGRYFVVSDVEYRALWEKKATP